MLCGRCRRHRRRLRRRHRRRGQRKGVCSLPLHAHGTPALYGWDGGLPGTGAPGWCHTSDGRGAAPDSLSHASIRTPKRGFPALEKTLSALSTFPYLYFLHCFHVNGLKINPTPQLSFAPPKNPPGCLRPSSCSLPGTHCAAVPGVGSGSQGPDRGAVTPGRPQGGRYAPRRRRALGVAAAAQVPLEGPCPRGDAAADGRARHPDVSGAAESDDHRPVSGV